MLEMANDSRVEYVDLAKEFAIIGMIVAHYCVWQKTDVVDQYVHDWFYSFHMPLFVILSGFFSKVTDVKSTIIKAGKSIMLPYYLFELIGNVMKIAIDSNSYSLSFKLGLLPGIFLGFQRYELLALWFLPALFVGKVVLSIIDRYCPKYDWTISVLLFMFVFILKSSVSDIRGIPLRMDIGLSFVFFLLVGRKIRTSNTLEYPLSLNSGLLLSLVLLAAYQFPVSFPGELSLPYGIISVILAVVFSFCVIRICKSIADNITSRMFYVLLYAGKHSLVILGLHSLTYLIGLQWFFHFGDGTVSGFFVALLTVALCYVVLKLYNMIFSK